MSLDINCIPITSDFNTCDGTPIAMGDFKQVGVLYPRSNIDLKSIVYDGCKVKFNLKVPGGGIPVYDRSLMPFDGTMTSEEVSRFKIYSDLVVFPIFERNAESSEILKSLSNTSERWVFINENEKVNATGDNRFIIKGLTAGLKLKSNMPDRANYAAWKVELEQKNSGFSELFYFDTDNATTVAIVDNMVAFDLITGGTIATGGAVKLTIDADKTGYVKLPNGTLLTTGVGTGVINTTYSGVGGAITYYVPKNNSSAIFMDSSAIAGDIIYGGIIPLYTRNSPYIVSIVANSTSQLLCADNVPYETNLLLSIDANSAIDIFCAYNEQLTSVIAPNVVLFNASNCALTAKSIGDNLIAFAANNPTAIGTANFSGGTNALDTEIANYLAELGIDFLTLVEGTLDSWTLTFRTAI